jgi:hypothetical protein
MFSVDVNTRECGHHVVVALRGELDMADAANVAAGLAEVAARTPEIIVDLAALAGSDGSSEPVARPVPGRLGKVPRPRSPVRPGPALGSGTR